MDIKKNDVIKIEIEDVTFDGNGVGKSNVLQKPIPKGLQVERSNE